MSEIRFYHLTRSTLEAALPRLLEKVLERGKRAVVVTAAERIAALDAALWTYDERAFLPHGAERDGHEADQPVWLSSSIENPNGASVLVMTEGGGAIEPSAWEMAIEFIDGGDEAAVGAARERWRQYKAAGHALTYWTQKPEGGWVKTA